MPRAFFPTGLLNEEGNPVLTYIEFEEGLSDEEIGRMIEEAKDKLCSENANIAEKSLSAKETITTAP